MTDRKAKPTALNVTSPDPSSLATVDVTSDSVKLSLPSGETANILLYGATVTSWVVDGEEKLFLSEKAKLDGSKAVRGGIPLVFPVFGTSDEVKLPQHGFARTSRWEFLGKTSEGGSSIQVDFGLGPENLSAEAKAAWPSNFGLIYTVTLTRKTLETKMIIRNEGTETFKFHVLFHTYFKVPDIKAVAVTGLKGIEYKDKVASSTAQETADALGISSETDRVYPKVPGTVEIVSGGKALYKIERTNVDDVVVWNPWTGSSKIADFGPEDGWQRMICVEAGNVADWTTLDGGDTWEGGQVISLE